MCRSLFLLLFVVVVFADNNQGANPTVKTDTSTPTTPTTVTTSPTPASPSESSQSSSSQSSITTSTTSAGSVAFISKSVILSIFLFKIL
ncbi:unnamed protein product [Hymenolepis diminuta]|uniref:REJ domain-containing protein n=1 Tax=Hymenolepis diminuta TaxID=6216 RepID=A0A564Y4D8_HYMDI|nr:unnamed protein product [Hymenolepis diminuta]